MYRSDSTDSAYSSVFYGNSVLLCKKLSKIAQLVSGDKIVPEAFAVFRGKAWNASENKDDDYDNRDTTDGIWILYDAAKRNSHSLYDFSSCLDMPYHLFCVRCKNVEMQG